MELNFEQFKQRCKSILLLQVSSGVFCLFWGFCCFVFVFCSVLFFCFVFGVFFILFCFLRQGLLWSKLASSSAYYVATAGLELLVLPPGCLTHILECATMPRVCKVTSLSLRRSNDHLKGTFRFLG